MSIIINEIKNSILSIDVVGAIGSSIFDEGFSTQNLQDKLNEVAGYDTIELNISSLGGNAYEGLNIFNMLEFAKTKGIKVRCNIIGAVASAAATIAMAGDERNMLENSLMLVHFVSGSFDGKVADVEEQMKQMQALNDNIIQIYTQKTGMSKDEMSKLMESEKWMSAKEALKNGFITSITKTPKTKNTLKQMEAIINLINESELPKVETNENVEVTSEVTTEVTETTEPITEVVEPVVPVVETTEPVVEVKDEVVEPITTEEIKPVTDMVDISNFITDIENLKGELALKNELINTLQSKVKEFEKNQKDTEINTLLNEAVRTQRISVTLKETYRKLLTSNFEDTKELISKLVPNKAVSLMDTVKVDDTRLDWTHMDWQKKDPNGLREMKASNPERYNELYNAYYKSVKK